MTKISVLLFGLLLISCSNPYIGVSEPFKSVAKSALSACSPSRSAEIRQAMESISPDYREGMAFMLAYMPRQDIDTIPCPVLVDNINNAYKARETYKWCASLPLDIFYEGVLPYSSADESREAWRGSLLENLTPRLSDAPTVYAAIDTIRNFIGALTVTAIPDTISRSPLETLERGGGDEPALTILTIAMLRAAGIPARMAGVASLPDNDGYHYWTEIWADGQWRFFDMTSQRLNEMSCLTLVGRTELSDSRKWVYNTTYTPAKFRFPLAWNHSDSTIYAADATARYIQEYKRYLKESQAISIESSHADTIDIARDSLR